MLLRVEPRVGSLGLVTITSPEECRSNLSKKRRTGSLLTPECPWRQTTGSRVFAANTASKLCPPFRPLRTAS